MKLGRLKRKDLMKISPHTTSEGKMNFSQTMDFLEVMAGILPDYVSDFAMMIDGTIVPIEQVLEEAFFMELMSDISMKLFSIAGIEKVEEGNSGVPPEESTAASSGTSQ